MKLKDACSLEEELWPTWQHIKKQKHYSAKVHPVKAMVFPVVMYGCESWTIKKAEGRSIEKITVQSHRVWTMVLGKTLESPLDGKGIQPVHPKGYQSWILIGGSDADIDTPILWPPDAKNGFTGEDPNAGKDRRQRRRGWQTIRRLDGLSLSKFWELTMDREAWRSEVHGVAKSQARLKDWTELKWVHLSIVYLSFW